MQTLTHAGLILTHISLNPSSVMPYWINNTSLSAKLFSEMENNIYEKKWTGKKEYLLTF